MSPVAKGYPFYKIRFDKTELSPRLFDPFQLFCFLRESLEFFFPALKMVATWWNFFWVHSNQACLFQNSISADSESKSANHQCWLMDLPLPELSSEGRKRRENAVPLVSDIVGGGSAGIPSPGTVISLIFLLFAFG